MNSNRGWYLVAVGVLALGISNSSIGNLSISDSARGFLDRAAAVADHLSAEAAGTRRRPANVQPRRSRLGSCPGYYCSCPNPPGACTSEDRCETGCLDQGAFMVCDGHSASGYHRIVFARGWRLGRRGPPIIRHVSSMLRCRTAARLCKRSRKFFYLNSRKAVIVVSLAIP